MLRPHLSVIKLGTAGGAQEGTEVLYDGQGEEPLEQWELAGCESQTLFESAQIARVISWPVHPESGTEQAGRSDLAFAGRWKVEGGQEAIPTLGTVHNTVGTPNGVADQGGKAGAWRDGIANGVIG